jgi:hypothetical protein
MSILIPKKNKLFPNLPMYLFFSDTENVDINFLVSLSSLVAKDELIDFYLEGGYFHGYSSKCLFLIS